MNTTDTLFPYEKFTFRLEYKENKAPKVCYFECQEHLDKYLIRHNLKKKDVNIDIKDLQKKKRGRKSK